MATGTCPCQSSYFEVGVVICSQCHFSCATCNGSVNTQCLTCPSYLTSHRLDYSLTTNSCPCDTVNSYYEANTQICGTCHNSCQTCSLGNAINQCDSCPLPSTTFHRIDNSGTTKTCPCETSYVDVGVKICS